MGRPKKFPEKIYMGMDKVICNNKRKKCVGCEHTVEHEPQHLSDEMGHIILCTQRSYCPDVNMPVICVPVKKEKNYEPPERIS